MHKITSKANMLSVNQQNDKLKLQEIWKSECQKLPTKNTETRTKTKYAINQSLYRRKTNRARKKNLDIQDLHQ